MRTDGKASLRMAVLVCLWQCWSADGYRLWHHGRPVLSAVRLCHPWEDEHCCRKKPISENSFVVQSDFSRVITVMVQDHAVVPQVEGVSGDHHNLSHHGQDLSKIGQLGKIEAGIVGCFGNLLEQVKRPTEFGSRLLDNSTIVFGSNLGNANAHEAKNLPIFLAGGGYDHGRYVDLRTDHDQPLCNLFVRLLQDCGIETEAFGQSTGRLIWG